MLTRRLGFLSYSLLLVLSACSREPEADPARDLLARERAAAHFEKQQYGDARLALQELVLRPDAPLEDLVRGASIEYSDNKPEAARALLARAAKIDARAPAVNYLLGQLARDAGEFERALPLLKAAHEAAPADLPTRLALAEVARELGDTTAAEGLYKSILETGLENGTNWYVAAVYRLSRLLIEEGRDAEAQKYTSIWRDLEKLGIRQPDATFMGRGNFGRLLPPAPTGSRIAATPKPPTYRAQPAILPELARARELHAEDLDGDARLDLWALTPAGLFAARENTARRVGAGTPALARAFDLENDHDLDFLVVEGRTAALFVQAEGAWTEAAIALPELPSDVLDVVAVDYDHEGDLDLLLVGEFGARVWRNDGAGMPAKDGKQGRFSDASEEAGLPSGRRFAWCATEDFDGDNDVDFLLGDGRSVFLADSLRGGRFADRSGAFPAGQDKFPNRPVLADLDGDARTDVWTGPLVYLQKPDASFRVVPAAHAVTLNSAAVQAQDLDLDGALDLVWSGSEGHLAQALLAAGTPQETLCWIDAEPALPGAGVLSFGDLDGDLTLDLVVSTAEGVRICAAAAGPNKAKPVAYKGLRDNSRAVGSVVEFRAGPIYRRLYWRGGPVLVGVGTEPRLDVLRITWPNGNVNTELDVDLAAATSVDDPEAAFGSYTQKSNLYASCPFLYSWDGQRNVFVSDVLGITPLGLPIAPGVFVPPDHDEYVLVKGEQLAARDGFYELQLTEELREVTYFDHARLEVVDHPSDSEIFPNELFKFPPFPEPHTHTLRGALSPARATGSDGRDWTGELARIDDVYAEPFTLPAPQFVGLANPWFVELAFDPARVASARKLRLALTGWFFWSDASANMASARAPGVAFVPPLFQVPDGQGGWRDAGPPVGFPAGKTKTMVIDVSDILDRADPRLRVFCALRLYWDAIRLAVDDDDAPLAVHALPATGAKLWMRGFSAPEEGDPSDALRRRRPERFVWERLLDTPPWNQHPGLYTRYGDVLPLVQAVDDQYVILGAGDALTLRFDARALPPPAAGMRRDFLVYLDGWAKDRDPNTVQALEVEPLPFHGMSGYPYRADERFPDDEAHRRWRAEWNTRPAFPWIRPLSAAREREWLQGG